MVHGVCLWHLLRERFFFLKKKLYFIQISILISNYFVELLFFLFRLPHHLNLYIKNFPPFYEFYLKYRYDILHDVDSLLHFMLILLILRVTLLLVWPNLCSQEPNTTWSISHRSCIYLLTYIIKASLCWNFSMHTIFML